MNCKCIYGDLLTLTSVDVIVHQCTCVTVKPRGLSLAIGKAFPWGDIYGQRKAVKGRNLAVQTSRDLPGTIKVFKAPEQGTPNVACLFAQWDFGTNVCRVEPYKRSDTKENRELWFKQCLSELGKTPYSSFGFPFKIGCDSAGGVWKVYWKLIKEFSNTYSKTVFVVVDPPVKPVLDLTNSSDDDIPTPEKKAIDSSSDSDKEESLLLSDSDASSISSSVSSLSDFSYSDSSSSDSSNFEQDNSVICID